MDSKVHKDNRIEFYEPFISEQETRRKTSDIGSAASWSNGKITGDGSANSFIDYPVQLSGTFSIRMKINSTSFAAKQYLFDCGQASGVGDAFLAITTGVLNISSGIAYVDGSAGTTIVLNTDHEITITGITLTASVLTALLKNDHAAEGLTGTSEGIEIYKGTLTANEVELLYENSLYIEPLFTNETLKINSLLGVIPETDVYGNTITNTNVVIAVDNGYYTGKYNGSTSKLACGDIGNTKSLLFWIKPNSLTEKFLEGAANDKLIHLNAGTLTYADFDNAFVNGVDTNTMKAGIWQCVMITSTTDVDMSAVTIALNNATYGEFLLGDIRFNSDEISTKQYEQYYHSTKHIYGE
jgi:hypothetical protein